MLSIFNAIFLINTLVIPPVCPGINCGPYQDVPVRQNIVAQELSISSTSKLSATRDGITVETVVVDHTQYSNLEQSIVVAPGSILDAASRYVGYGWDCTRLVEQALRDMGYAVPDLGPMGFGGYGSVFGDPSQAQAGDIMMRGGHVSIYAGDGYSIQGGYNGRVVIVADSPSNYSSFVRVN